MKVSTCCCVCSLQMGCIIIAILGLIGGGGGFYLGFYKVWTEPEGASTLVVSSILGLVSSGGLLVGGCWWGTQYDNFIVNQSSQCTYNCISINTLYIQEEAGSSSLGLPHRQCSGHDVENKQLSIHSDDCDASDW